MNYIISIDQSTSATKAILFDDKLKAIANASIEHQQYYPREGWVEHDAMEIYKNTVSVIRDLLKGRDLTHDNYTLAITNQRETIVAWDRQTGLPIYHALVWQDTRGAQLCQEWRSTEGLEELVSNRTGLKVDPSFCASKMRWILDNIDGAREKAEHGEVLFGTIDTWLVWKLTEGRVFATDYTNASRTMLFDIHTLTWDDELCQVLGVPRKALAEPKANDAVYGETSVEGLFSDPIKIAGVLGDSHAALLGQMCFKPGTGKVTYGTGSSVMLNIGPTCQKAPKGLVSSIGFSLLGQTSYAYEGNIYSTGATLKWLADQLKLIQSPIDTDAIASSVTSTGGVYFIPAFAGLGAPWWQDKMRAAVLGMTFSTTKAQVVRAAVESIAYQVTDLVRAMLAGTGVAIHEISADGGPTHNHFLMQLQADLLGVDIVTTEVSDASAFGAAVAAGFAVGLWKTSEEVALLKNETGRTKPQKDLTRVQTEYEGWQRTVKALARAMTTI